MNADSHRRLVWTKPGNGTELMPMTPSSSKEAGKYSPATCPGKKGNRSFEQVAGLYNRRLLHLHLAVTILV